MSKHNIRIFGLAVIVLLIAALAAVWLWHRNTGYTIQTTAQGTAMAEPVLPDIAGFTTEAVVAMLPQLAPGEIEVKRMESSPYFNFMSMNSLLPDIANAQGEEEPVSIEIKSGVYDLNGLSEKLADPELIEKTADGWILKRPVIVQHGATLIISGENNAVKLSASKGVFISNFGQLYIVNTTMTGWSEQDNAPSVYEDSKIFRPYLTFWSGSKTWLAGTKFLNLGYSFPKSYGISFSSSAKMLRKDPGIAPPTGWVVNCLFKDLYYGFYSYEADDVAIIHNTYEDNIVYGIDPHDRSNRLIIAENHSFGAKKRHGIIVSRQVNNSWIFNNHTHDNHGSGIMIDRNSRNNIIANNLSENNGGDGLVFFESPDNTTWNNKIQNNAKDGIRIRNSTNIILHGDKILNNGAYGVEAYTASLEDQETRDPEFDPYEMRTSYDIADSVLENNKGGHFQAFNIDYANYSNVTMLKSLKYFKGDFEAYEGPISAGATSKNMTVHVKANSYTAPTSKDIRDTE